MAKPKLCEIIAVAGGKKGETEKALGDSYHKLQKAELFDGMKRTYRPREENGETLPEEQKHPQMRLGEVIADNLARLRELFDLTLTLDAGNCVAKADVVIDDKPLLTGLPVPTTLFLEKQLQNVIDFVSKIPTPDPAEQWRYDGDQDMLTAGPRYTVRTKKIQKPIVLFPATPEHPAQTQLVTEDVAAGDWSQVLFTTRMPAAERNAILERAKRLKDAVEAARSRANVQEVDKKEMGETVLNYIFGTAYRKPAGK
jgi:hypothetical protein